VIFTLYKNDSTACQTNAAIVYTSPAINVTGSGPYTASTSNTSSSTPTYAVTAVTAGDTYKWKAAYTSGDAGHKNVTSCVETTAFSSLSNGSPVTSP
jgi:hypothetical protein